LHKDRLGNKSKGEKRELAFITRRVFVTYGRSKGGSDARRTKLKVRRKGWRFGGHAEGEGNEIVLTERGILNLARVIDENKRKVRGG